MALDGNAPAEAAEIVVEGQNKWPLIQNARNRETHIKTQS